MSDDRQTNTFSLPDKTRASRCSSHRLNDYHSHPVWPTGEDGSASYNLSRYLKHCGSDNANTMISFLSSKGVETVLLLKDCRHQNINILRRCFRLLCIQPIIQPKFQYTSKLSLVQPKFPEGEDEHSMNTQPDEATFLAYEACKRKNENATGRQIFT